MGLAGNEPATVDIDSIPVLFATSKRASRLLLAQVRHEVDLRR